MIYLFLLFYLSISESDNKEPRLFYATGEKNPNMQKQVEKYLRPKPLLDLEKGIQEKIVKTTKKKTK